MGPHMVALAKLKLLSSASHSISPVILASLMCPFALKFSFSFRFVRQASTDVLYALRLFFFQLGQIAFESEAPAALGNGSRWERALRLICQRVTHAGRLHPTESDEDNFHSLTVLSL